MVALLPIVTDGEKKGCFQSPRLLVVYKYHRILVCAEISRFK